ncbi:MAG: hypothetical protein J0M34_05135 [Alphaproteobacteria bacterium]|nr:hypothetical protein [Alphaproteobacteria bacterium]
MVIALDTSQITRERNAPAQLAASPDLRSESGEKRFITEGEKRFNWLTYTGVNYGLNVALSLIAVYWANRTHTGTAARGWWKKQWDKIPGISDKLADTWSNRSFFLTGGFAVLLPVKWLEDARSELVHKYNREIYGERADTDPVIQQAERDLADAPRQGWTSIISSRVLSLIPFYFFTGFVWDKASKLSKLTNESVYVDKPIIAASRWIGKTISKVTGDTKTLDAITDLERTAPGVFKDGVEVVGRDPNRVAWPYYFINEAITSWMVAAAMFPITRIVAPFTDGEYRKEQKEKKQPPVEEVAVSTHAPRTHISAREKDYQQRVESAPQQQALAK